MKRKNTLTTILLLVAAYLAVWVIEMHETHKEKVFRLVEMLLMAILIYIVLFFACTI